MQVNRFFKILVVMSLAFILPHWSLAAPTPMIIMPKISIGSQAAKPQSLVMPLQLLILFSILSLAPYLMMMMTSFVRVTIVLSFIRSSLGTQQVPPTQVLMGLALFITFYIMAPVGRQINDQAIRPMIKGELTQSQAFERAEAPVRDFMLRQVQKEDLALFYDLAKVTPPANVEKTPLYILIPAFMVSEIKIGFEIGFLIYIPFLIIDMVVASVLMSMGMFMLSPMSISLPFKLLLFVMVDGWELIIKGLILSFH
jgi:flagellar biosynthetic protein FliP